MPTDMDNVGRPTGSKLRRLEKASTNTEFGSQLDRWYPLVAIASLLVLALIAGAAIMQFGWFPADHLRRAFKGGAAWYASVTEYQDRYKTDFWKPARTEARGVIQYDLRRAQNGVTLYSSGHDQRAFLIDMHGKIVHEWSLPFSKIWDESAAVTNPVPDDFIYIEKAHVLPNGDLIALYTAIGDTPWGYGLVKMNRDSEIIWKYLGHAHHDFELDDEGNIYLLSQEISEASIGNFDYLPKPRIDDLIVKLSPEGRVLETSRVMNAFAKSKFGRRLYFSSTESARTGDYLHANSIDILTKAIPGIPQSQPGQLLISLRETSMLALVDIVKDEMVWAQTGPWSRQHDAQFLPSGHALLFDNEGGSIGPGRSRVIEFDPKTFEIVWSYGDRRDEPLDSVARSSQNRLPNGNTLIVESMAGRVLEVTDSGDTVWEFVNPVRGGQDEAQIPIIFWVQRFDPEQYLTEDARTEFGL